MPELPEAETVRRHLQDAVAGRRIRAVRVHQPDILLNASVDAFARALRDRRIRRVSRRGKWPLLHLDARKVVEVQLRMTGRFALGAGPPDPATYGHVAAELYLDDGRTLYYDDRRRLGGFNLWTRQEWTDRSATLGPEPLDDGFTDAHLERTLRDRRAAVKNLLLDPEVVAGVGNLYAAEALHRAGLDPRRAGGGLDVGEIGELCSAVQEVLRAGLRHGGSSFSDFLSPAGEPGRHQEHLAVYGREGRPCPRCSGSVQRIVQSGRGTYFCPGCQG